MDFTNPGFMPYEGIPYGEMPYEYGMEYTPADNLLGTIAGIVIFSVVAALILAVLTHIFVLPEKRSKNLGAFWKRLADIFNFKTLYIEKILKFLYVSSTYLFIICGISMLIYSVFAEYMSLDIAQAGLTVMIVGPIVLRLVYEIFMLSVIGVKNLISTNDKLDNIAKTIDNGIHCSCNDCNCENTDNVINESDDGTVLYTIVKNDECCTGDTQPDNVPEYRYCTRCGTRYDVSCGSCPNGCN